VLNGARVLLLEVLVGAVVADLLVAPGVVAPRVGVGRQEDEDPVAVAAERLADLLGERLAVAGLPVAGREDDLLALLADRRGQGGERRAGLLVADEGGLVDEREGRGLLAGGGGVTGEGEHLAAPVELQLGLRAPGVLGLVVAEEGRQELADAARTLEELRRVAAVLREREDPGRGVSARNARTQ
jgi:hypothetical protein